GSAQLSSNEYAKAAGASKAKELKDNAWFEGFAPRSNPEIVVVALFEHGYRGQFAAPIVRDVLKAYFDKKARLAAYRQMESRMAAMSSLGLPDAGGTRQPAPAPKPSAPVDAAIMEIPAPSATPPPSTVSPARTKPQQI